VTRCSSCGATISWVFTTSGKRMPVERAEPAVANIRLERLADAAGHLRTTAVMLKTGQRSATHIAHFATCPNADAHRGRLRQRTFWDRDA
jgi:hypothetical protein